MNPDSAKWQTWRSVADFAATILILVTTGAIAWRSGLIPFGHTVPQEPPVQARVPTVPTRAMQDIAAAGLTTTIDREASRMGDRRAPVVLVEFSDYQCPFCARHSRETLKQIEREFVSTGKVEYVVRNLPLERHKFALAAAQAVECAGVQGRFWEMRRVLFARGGDLADSPWLKPAGALGLDVAAFSNCLDGTMLAKVQGDVAEASRLGVVATPTFLVGRKNPDGDVQLLGRIDGAQPIEVFRKGLERTFGKI